MCKVFTLPQACKIVGCAYGRAREWIDNSFFKPMAPAGGQGMPAWFSLDDVFRLKLFLTLVEGCPGQIRFTRKFAGELAKDEGVLRRFNEGEIEIEAKNGFRIFLKTAAMKKEVETNAALKKRR